MQTSNDVPFAKQVPTTDDSLEAQPIGDYKKLKKVQARCTGRANAHRKKWWLECYSLVGLVVLFAFAMWVMSFYIPEVMVVSFGVAAEAILIMCIVACMCCRDHAIAQYRGLGDDVGDVLEFDGDKPAVLKAKVEWAKKEWAAINQQCRKNRIRVDEQAS